MLPRALLAIAGLGFLTPVYAADTASFTASPTLKTIASATSPDESIVVAVNLDNDGRPSYTLTRKGQLLLGSSRLGFILTDAPKLERHFVGVSNDIKLVDETWDQPWGEWKTVRNRYKEMKVHLKETTALARSLDIVFRIYDDGVGFRYEFPDQPNLKNVHIASELTEFNFATEGTAFWTPGGEWNRYEYIYNKTPIAEVGTAHTPLSFKLKDGTHLALHEAALVDYAGMRLRHVEGRRFRADLAPSATSGAAVERAAPFPTPWRTLRISDTAAGLYNNQLELNLNEPNKLGDVSWVKPMKYVGVWWEMHLGLTGWGHVPVHGATTENTKRYIDFAAKNGFKGVLVEGWNLGWDKDWFANGDVFDYAKAMPDYDFDAVAKYAKKKGVEIIGHQETGGGSSGYEKQLDEALDTLAAHGVHAIKTGYVADAAGIQHDAGGQRFYEWHDGQWNVRHHLKVVEEAAKRHIAVNAHEPVKDTGLRRTYPNWVSREAARGMEFNAWGEPKNPVEHEATLFYTRMLSGPMDFTPGVLSLEGKGKTWINSTIAKQLGLYVVLYSPIQMAADLPENYEKHKAAFRFIRDVPADWADTKALTGEIGEDVVVARKDRNSDAWYLGGVTDDKARDASVKLDFLDAGRKYRAEIYRDGDAADYRNDRRFDIVIEKKTVTAADILNLRMAPGGGFAVRFVPLGK